MYIRDDICYAGTPAEDRRIVAARVLAGGMMLIEFASGERRLWDITLLKEPVFQPLQDEKVLREFVIFHGILTWQNGEIDIAPETVYAMSYPYEMDKDNINIA